MDMLSTPSLQSSPSTGFSLVELSVVLVIIGLIASSSLTAMNSQLAAAKRTQTLAKMQTIEKAIASFLAINNRIPCPAHSGLPLNNPASGQELCIGIASKSMTGALPAGYETRTGDPWIIAGSVPTKALQLPDEFMMDGWGNRFTYVMTEALGSGHSETYGPPANDFTFDDTTTGLITVKDGTSQTISLSIPIGSLLTGKKKKTTVKATITGTRTNEAAYVLLSHGPNRFGGWLHDGNGQWPASPNTDEQENSEWGKDFDEVFIQREANATFDDIVHYKMKWQLTREAGALISNNNCQTARALVNQTISCAENAMPDCNAYLLSLANQVRNWCIQ